METVYVLNTYEYDTYSYSGITVSEIFIHKTRGGAEKHAEKLGLKVVEYANSDKDCTIDNYSLED